MDYSSRGRKESDTTERLTHLLSLFTGYDVKRFRFEFKSSHPGVICQPGQYFSGSLISSDFTPLCFCPDMWGVGCQRGAGDMRACEEVVISVVSTL